MDITKLEEKLNYSFKDKTIIEQALTHSSYANERKINVIPDYERIEFLGDAVLELTVSDFLYSLKEEYSEGRMTRMRAALVCEPTLAKCLKDFGLDEFILLSKGEENTGGRKRDSILCDVFESIVGALYIDGGIEVAKGFIKKALLSEWENRMIYTDSKSILQEYVQEQGRVLTYVVIKEDGPSHNKTFYVDALVDGCVISSGVGHSKKSAEQLAAYNYLKETGIK